MTSDRGTYNPYLLVKMSNNHLGTTSQGRVRAMASSYSNGMTSPSHIPLPKYTSAFRFNTECVMQQSKSPKSPLEQSINDNKWKSRYEEAEKKRKALLTENQRSVRDYANLERRYKELNNDLNVKEHQLNEKITELHRLRQVSEGLYQEYEKLKNKYDVETNAMHSAMKTASQWYTQNRELKRKSAVLVQKFLEVSPGGILDLADEADASGSSQREDDELEGLRNTVKGLSEEIAKLQTELKTARLQEFEAQEQVFNLTSQLDEEREAHSQARCELQELRVMKGNMQHVSKLVAVEMSSLREQCEQEREVALRMKKEANVAQKERNVLVHQSTLLLSDVIGDEKFLRVLQEVESLKRELEEQKQRYTFELQELQDKLEIAETDAQVELLEEKLKLSESELQCALQRAERAENYSSQLGTKVNQLEEELNQLKCPPPPPPPPLPPPPPPPGNFGSWKKLSATTSNNIQEAEVSQDTSSCNPVLDMANMLGIPRKTVIKPAPQGGAIDDIINQIKGGRFTLKTPEKHVSKKEEETPAAVQEMLNVLGTLKRRQKNPARQAATPNNSIADVAL